MITFVFGSLLLLLFSVFFLGFLASDLFEGPIMDVIDTSLRSAGSREKLNPKNQGYDEEQVVIVS
jgi:hypothetical protein